MPRVARYNGSVAAVNGTASVARIMSSLTLMALMATRSTPLLGQEGESCCKSLLTFALALTRCTDVHTIGAVDYDWDEDKAASNLQK